MQILCYNSAEDQAVVQLTQDDVEKIKQSFSRIEDTHDGPLHDTLQTIGAAIASISPSRHPERGCPYSAMAPCNIIKDLMVLACSANACLTQENWAALIE